MKRKAAAPERSPEGAGIDRRTVLRAGAATIATFSLGSLSVTRAFAGSEPVVETTFGKVRGALSDGAYSFRGVRYGASTAGENRFMPPRKPQPWAGVQDALQYGNIAPQANPNPPPPGTPSPIILSQLAPPGAPPPPPGPQASEDCLFLNVWTSGLNDGRKRPVMVWLHGGFFYGGSGATGDGSRLAARGDVVVVSLNHRLNIFGYSHLADLGGAEYAHSGNAGMLDIVAALEWVRDNIERFGGDPKRVMVFGVSGGGMKTAFLMASPRAQGLLHRAGIQSGPGLKMMERDRANQVAETMLAELGIKRAELGKLRSLPTERLLAAYWSLRGKIPEGDFEDLVAFAPVLDPQVLPQHPFTPAAAPLMADIPMLIGWNEMEMIFFMGADEEAFSLDEAGARARFEKFLGEGAQRAYAAYRKAHPGYSPADLYIRAWSDYSIGHGTLVQADRKVAQRGAATYVYRFDWRTPVLEGKLQSMHTLETPFIFDNTAGQQRLTGGGPQAAALARRMSECWVSFAASGDPNSQASGLPRWPAYDARRRPTMIFDNESRVANDPMRMERELLARIAKKA